MRTAYLRDTKGHLHGRPANAKESKYLLTGFSQCGVCNGSLYVRSRSHGRRRKFFYACTAYALRGTRACTNNVHIPLDDADRTVLVLLGQQVLDGQGLGTLLLQQGADMVAHAAQAAHRHHALQDLARQQDRITEGIKLGGSIPALVAELKIPPGETDGDRGGSRGPPRPLLTRRDQEGRAGGPGAVAGLGIGDSRGPTTGAADAPEGVDGADSLHPERGWMGRVLRDVFPRKVAGRDRDPEGAHPLRNGRT